jgi:hypothetical protein
LSIPFEKGNSEGDDAKTLEIPPKVAAGFHQSPEKVEMLEGEKEKNSETMGSESLEEARVKDSSLGVSKPPVLILPAGDTNGSRRGTQTRESEPGEANSQGVWGPIVSIPSSPRTQYPVPVKHETETQTHQETSATDSDRSEPRFETLIKTFKGMQHTLQALTQGFREMIRGKKWAQKAHARRERRRAARQKEVGNQPQPPADNRQENPDVEGNGSVLAEAGTQPPIEDWAPPTELSQGSGWEYIGPTAGNRETGGPVEAGDQERPRRAEYACKATQVEGLKIQEKKLRGMMKDGMLKGTPDIET